jgi:hypothetical protein
MNLNEGGEAFHEAVLAGNEENQQVAQSSGNAAVQRMEEFF